MYVTLNFFPLWLDGQKKSSPAWVCIQGEQDEEPAGSQENFCSTPHCEGCFFIKLLPSMHFLWNGGQMSLLALSWDTAITSLGGWDVLPSEHECFGAIGRWSFSLSKKKKKSSGTDPGTSSPVASGTVANLPLVFLVSSLPHPWALPYPLAVLPASSQAHCAAVSHGAL
jgi:hypothetical protein